DILTRDEEIDAANAVPAFDARRRVSARMPPPTALAIRAVMDRGDLAELQRVDDEADVSVAREPDAVRLERGLVAVSAHRRMAAHIEHRWEPSARRGLRRTVEVGGDVKA